MPRGSSLPVKPITAKLSKDVLIQRLKECCDYLEEMDQLEDDPPIGLSELAMSLVRQGTVGNKDKLVRLYAATAIAEVLRVYAPDAPYEDEDLKEILMLFVSQLRCLDDLKGPHYSQYVHLLQNLSKFNTFLVRTDDGVAAVLVDLCTTLFDIISDNQELPLKNAILDILSVIVREAEFIPKGLVEVILLQLVHEQKALILEQLSTLLKYFGTPHNPSQSARYQLASSLIKRTVSDLEPYIRQALVNILLVGHQSDSEIGHHVITVLYQLSLIEDSTLTSILPQLELKLKSLDREERLQYTQLLDKMFSEEGSNLAQRHPNLWKAFLGRFEDIDMTVRIAAVDSTPHFFDHQPMLIDDITGALHSRCHDIEERVRLRAVHVVHDVACKHFDAVPMQLFHDVKERMWDRKRSVREVAISRLADLFTTVSRSREGQEASAWIPASMLSGYFRGGAEDRELIGTCFTTMLHLSDADVNSRAHRILHVFTNLDHNAKRYFGDMLKTQTMIQKNFRALVQLMKEQCPEAKWKSLLATIAKSTSDPQTLLDSADTLALAFQQDSDLVTMVLEATDPECSCAAAMKTKNSIFKSLASNPQLHGVLSRILNLSCPSFVDADCVKVLVHNIHEDSDMEEDSHLLDAFMLLETLSQNYPVLFTCKEIFEDLLDIILNSCTSAVVCSGYRILLNFAGPSWTADPSYQQQLSSFEVHAVKSALKGTPEVAKEAVKCLKHYSTSLDSIEKLHGELVVSLCMENPHLPTVLTSLREIAKLESNVFELEVDGIIGDFVIKQVLRHDDEGDKPRKGEQNYDVWCSEDTLPNAVKIKILCIKLLKSWLLGQSVLSKEKSDKVLVILHGMLVRRGDLNNSKSLSSGSLAHLRLTAAKVMLELVSKRKDFTLSLSDFLQLALVAQDPCKEVRVGFLEKLHKGLATCHLPLSYMAIFSYYGVENDKAVLATAKRYIHFNVERRRKLAHELSVPKEKAFQLQPEYCLPYAIYMLAHHPKLSRLDFANLDSFKDCLWFILEPIVKNGESHGLLYCILTSIKQSVDTRNPDNLEANKKLYAMCDLAQILLGSKATGAKASRRQDAVTLPKHLYTHNDKSVYHVTDVFLPPEYVTSLHKSIKTTPISRAYGSPQRQSASRNTKNTPSSANDTPTSSGPGGPGVRKQEQYSSQEESPLKRPSKSRGASKPKRHLPIAEELSTISELSEGISMSVTSNEEDLDHLVDAKRSKRSTHSKKTGGKEGSVRSKVQRKSTRKRQADVSMESISEEASPSKIPVKKSSQHKTIVQTKRRSKRK